MRSNLKQWQQLQEQDYFEKHSLYCGMRDDPVDGISDLIQRFTPLSENMNVVEIGCGYGRTVCHIAPRVKHVYGIDVNGRILAKAVAYLAKHGVTNFTPVFADCYASDIPGKIDLVFSLNVMQHLTRDLVADYFKILVPKLSPTGSFVMQFIEARLGEGEHDARLAVYEPSVNWTAWEIADLCRDSGLQLCRIETHLAKSSVLWHWLWCKQSS